MEDAEKSEKPQPSELKRTTADQDNQQLDAEGHGKYIHMRTSMEDEQEKCQTHFSEYLKKGIEADMIQEVYKKATIKGDPTMKRTHNPQPSQCKSLKGTTCFVLIGSDTTIELVADQRTGWTIPNTQLGLIWVYDDNFSKVYHIHSHILATAAGSTDICVQTAQSAMDLYRVTYGDVSAPEGAYVVARMIGSMLNNWEKKNPGELSPDFIVAGFHHHVPLILKVNSSTRGGIVCVRMIGNYFSIGSGSFFALDFARANYGILQPKELIESALVAASLQEPGTGGHVERATLQRDQAASFWNPPLSILQLLWRDLHRYKELLKYSLFFYCLDYQYEPQNEENLSLALRQRFPTYLRDHVISKRTLTFRIITFQSDPPPELVGQATNVIRLRVVDEDVKVQFFEPTSDNLLSLCQYEQMPISSPSP